MSCYTLSTFKERIGVKPMKKKQLFCGVLGLLIMGSLAACSSQPAPSNETSVLTGNAQYSSTSEEKITDGEQFAIYEQYGMTYDINKKELTYNGKLVRWFEDYYPVDDDSQAGIDFFNENGVVDVYAVRDFTTFAKDENGSIDPRGELLGLQEFSQEEFDARNIDAIKNPNPQTAIAGDPISDDVINTWLAEYKDFGVTYDKENDQWYFNGEKVRYFRDVLTSNGESLSGGKFHGTMRTFGNGNGNIDVYTVRDFDTPNSEGNGTLTDIKVYSQQEFDEHTHADYSNNGSYGSCATTE